MQTRHAIIDTITDHIALLDSNGRVIEVNAAWKRFSVDNNGVRGKTGIGRNYLDVCRHAAAQGIEEASELLSGLIALLHGERESIEVSYPCHSPTENRWFIARAARVHDGGEVAVAVIHRNVTVRTQLSMENIILARRIQEMSQNFLLSIWTGFLAHEIKNPLTNILLRTQVLKRMMQSKGTADPNWIQNCESIESAIHYCVEVVAKIRKSIPSTGDENIEEIDVESFLNPLTSIFRNLGNLYGVQIHDLKPENNLRFQIRKFQATRILMRVVLHLMKNCDGLASLHVQDHGAFVKITFEGCRPFQTNVYRGGFWNQFSDLGLAKKGAAQEGMELLDESTPLRVSLHLLIPKHHPEARDVQKLNATA